ncbi:alpha/beta hydrolase family protein [Gillisia limnaea]|uniref:Alpha/beta hydrolase fold containing protein n=1 Tax=Gillisia limnaea (strain DSM 15749 / LMG 21470 / R-8282) TaxID=865937 RepID=H2BSX5_GILLR|nr:alpha/beta fold hydrolase [Gillisia limnaea]EHQ01505.1 alpha/beta hydrolase fold containing protein [Gillisia limnaea DSM 15749]
MKKLLIIATFLILPFLGISQDIRGAWNGNLEVQAGRKILFIFKISGNENQLTTEIAIPSQGVKGLQSQSTSFEDGVLLIDASNLGFKFNGKWNVTSSTIEGSFQEGVNTVPLVLTKEAILEVKPNRPQEPIKPYPYHVEEVTFTNQKDKVTLAGTLTIPKLSQKKPPVVILISGSGPQDRDESFMTHKPFFVLSDYLTRRGIAVLRYDDRGFGESTGNFAEGTTADFATDVLSAIEFLKNHPQIDKSKIGLIGHSEGAIISPMVANQSIDVGFIVMLAGTGTTGKFVSYSQSIDSRNFPVPDQKQFEDYVKEAIDIASSEIETDSVKEDLTTFYQNSEMLKSLLPVDVNKEEFIQNLVTARTTPWIRYFYNYNPVDEIKKIKIPALALYGSKDTQVPPKYHLQQVKEALAASKSKNQEVVLLEGLNHIFQESKTGLTSEYAQLEQTFAPAALETIGDWIIKQTK